MYDRVWSFKSPSEPQLRHPPPRRLYACTGHDAVYRSKGRLKRPDRRFGYLNLKLPALQLLPSGGIRVAPKYEALCILSAMF